jgi:hypothetical protein
MLATRLAKLEDKRLRKVSAPRSIAALPCLIAAIEEAKNCGTFPQSLCDDHLEAIVSGVSEARGYAK